MRRLRSQSADQGSVLAGEGAFAEEAVDVEEPEVELNEENGADESPEQLAEETSLPKAEQAKPDEKSVSTPEQPTNTSEPEHKEPHKKVDFEITNPDDIDIDDKGQLGLF